MVYLYNLINPHLLWMIANFYLLWWLNAPPAPLRDPWVRKKMTVTGLRMVHELRGIPCIPLEELPPPKKQIICSRSFGYFIETLQDMEQAMTFYASRAAERMRSQNTVSSVVMVWIETSRFSGSYYAPSIVQHIPRATNYTPDIVNAVLEATRRIYRKGYRYRKGGVMLLDLQPAQERQFNLLSPRNEAQEEHLMKVLDGVNKKYGANSLFYAASGIQREWKMMRQMKSPHYTTNWKEIPITQC